MKSELDITMSISNMSDHSNHHGSDDLPITMASQINALTSTYDKMNESHCKCPGNNKGKGKSHVNVVEGDGFTNVVDMEVDRFDDPDVFHEAPMIENWEFDVEDTGMNAAGPVGGPSSFFRSSSLPPRV